jgi:hypothetical protein
MVKKKIRDNSYYEKVLKRDHRAIYDDLMAGRIPSMRQALLLAGLKRPPSPLNGLKREWKKAVLADRRKFFEWVRHESGRSSKGSPVTPPVPRPITGPDGRLLPEVVDRVRCVMGIRSMKMGGACTEMGLAVHDYRLPRALDRVARTEEDVVRAIESWLLRSPLPAHLSRAAT